ncbi:MAG TPA: heavy-metal-associated domain-containing protein [Thiobacillaceae bacterium]|nr:heavy-metal-associated domain-containing protein [Thiobacillaceae bacterium]
MREQVLTISGMTCGGCVNSVTRVLKALPGVQQVDVSLVPGQAKLLIDETQVDISMLKKAITEAGYAVVD